MSTRPTLSSYPEDAELWKWTTDVEEFIEELIGNNDLPSAPAEVKVVSQSNSVKVTFRAVNEVGVSEYNVYRGTDKNYTGDTAVLIATVSQAIDPTGTDIVYTDVEAVEKSYYFISAVKGLRRPKIEGPVAGFGSATSGHAIGESDDSSSILSGVSGIPGAILFVDEDGLIGQDSNALFFSSIFRAMVVGTAGLMWGPQKSPDITLIRDAADTLALRRGVNNQTFRIYETIDGTDDRYVEITGVGASGGAEVMAVTGVGGTDKELIIGTRGNEDTVVHTNDIEVARFGADASFGINVVNLADAMFFDSGTILGTTNPRIWMGQTATRDSTNFMIGSLGTDETRVNAIRTVHLTVSNDSYLTCSNVGITQVNIRRRVHIDPLEDQVQFLVDGFSTQVNDLVQFQTFDNINVFSLNVDGDTTWPLAPVQTAFGGAIIDSVKHLFSGTHLSGGVGTSAALMLLDSVLTGADEDTVSLYGVEFDPTIVTQTATESIANIASLNIEEPKITDNLTGLITVASTVRIGGAPDEGVANWALNVVSGASIFGGSLEITGVSTFRSNIAQSNVAEGGVAQMVYKTAHEVHTLAAAKTSDTTTISIPAGAKLLGASFNVNTAVTDDDGDNTWSAAFITGASESLASAAAAALDTKVNTLTANDEVATATTEIQFTANGSNFTAGVIEIVVYYMELTSLADV